MYVMSVNPNVMITAKRVLLCLLLGTSPFFLRAQCVDPLSSVTLDTTVTGVGNANHTFTFPQFNASLGTLVAVVIRTEVTLRYRFDLENREAVAINNYRVQLVRDDEFSGSAIPLPITNNYQRTYGPYSLGAYDGVPGSGSDYVTVGPVYAMNHQVVENTLHNTADYLGAGTVSMDYIASTYSIVFGSVNYNFNGTAEDTVRLTVIYKYCKASALAADVLDFNAMRRSNGTIDLWWTTPNERNGRNYSIEKSSDGRNFNTVASMKAQPGGTGSYRYNYTPQGNESGKLIFRLKQIEADGIVKYSVLRVVDIGKKTVSPIVYPNPSSGNFNIVFHNTKRGDWTVEVMTLSGQLLKQLHFSRALTARINLRSELSKGTYMLRITDRKTGEHITMPVQIQ
jgi:hypothetical protein